VAIEATHTGPWDLAFERAGASVRVQDLDGDGVESVVGTFPVEGVDLARHRLSLDTARNTSDVSP
jgi:hypothetical protein